MVKKNSAELCRKPVMTKTKTPVVKKETISVKTFKAGKNATYLQCSNAYSPEHPHCHNTIEDGEEYLVSVCAFENGYILQDYYCEGCVRDNKHLEVEFEKAHDAKPSKPKGSRILTLVDDIRLRLKTYDGNDKISLKAIETALDEIQRIENSR